MKPAPALWYLRERELPSGLWCMAGFETGAHRDGELLTVSPDEKIQDGWFWRTHESERGILRVDIAAEALPKRPALWFVNVDEPKGGTPATNLVAFATDHHEPGTIISRWAFATMGVHNDLQVGAVRWYRTGVVDQIFIAKQWRRQQAATAILVVADAFHQSNAWPGFLRSDGRRTNLGKFLAAGVRHPQRFAPLTADMPSMDPEDYASAVD